MNNCPICGAALLEGKQFCSQCGSRVRPAPAPVPETSAAAQPDAASAAPTAAETQAAPAAPECPAMPALDTPAADVPEETPDISSASAASDAAIAGPPAAPILPPVAAAPETASSRAFLYRQPSDPKPDKASAWAPIGTGGWFGILLLMHIPVVNLILIIVWSCNARKQNKKSFARAGLIWLLLCAIFYMAGCILLYKYGGFLVHYINQVIRSL